MVQLSHPYMTTGKIIALTRWNFIGKITSLLFNMLSRYMSFMYLVRNLLINMIVDQFFTCRAMKRYLVTWLKHGVSQVQCSFKNTVVADLIFTFQQDLFVQNSLTLHFPPLPVRISLFYFYFILLYNTVLVLPYIDVNQPRVYMSSQSWTPLPPSTPYHLSGSSLCPAPSILYPVSNID